MSITLNQLTRAYVMETAELFSLKIEQLYDKVRQFASVYLIFHSFEKTVCVCVCVGGYKLRYIYIYRFKYLET